MVRWAALNTPLERRWQTFSIILWVMVQVVCVAVYICLLLNPITCLPAIAYGVWILFIDSAPESGSRPSKWMRSKFFLWGGMRDYFPIQLVKTADLDPTQNYIFGYHPHGIIGLGAWINFGTDVTGFDRLFPGISLHLLTLSMNFKIPIYRDYLMSLGLGSVSRRSCNNVLRSGQGESIMIVVGGAAEALDAHPGTYNLTLNKRRGFIKVALQNGAHLVPVFGFGENEVWKQVDNPQGSWVRWIQERMKSTLSFTVPFFFGRGVFNYDYGFMPFRVPITAVVGEPIEVPKVAKPTQEQIDDLHEEYCKALEALFEKYKYDLLPKGSPHRDDHIVRN